MNKKTGWAITVSVLALCALLALAACSKKEETPAASPMADQTGHVGSSGDSH